jgi:hypothetical protein
MANFASRISRETVCLNRRLRLINIDTPFRCSAVVSPAEWKLQDHKLIAPAIYFRSAVANVMAGVSPGPQIFGSVSACAGAFRPSVGMRRPEKSDKPPSSRARQCPETGLLMPIEGKHKRDEEADLQSSGIRCSLRADAKAFALRSLLGGGQRACKRTRVDRLVKPGGVSICARY